MVLLVDNYDSFTYNLYQYLRILGQDVKVARNDQLALDDVSAWAPDLIVISPGPGGPEATGQCLRIIDVFKERIPLLGICLGMQTIASYFGAAIVRAREPMHGKTRAIRHDGKGLFRGLPNPLTVTRYHSLVVDPENLPECLEVSARSAEGEIMALRHKSLPLSGVQFHPEAVLTEAGLDLLRNALVAIQSGGGQ